MLVTIGNVVSSAQGGVTHDREQRHSISISLISTIHQNNFKIFDKNLFDVFINEEQALNSSGLLLELDLHEPVISMQCLQQSMSRSVSTESLSPDTQFRVVNVLDFDRSIWIISTKFRKNLRRCCIYTIVNELVNSGQISTVMTHFQLTHSRCTS